MSFVRLLLLCVGAVVACSACSDDVSSATDGPALQDRGGPDGGSDGPVSADGGAAKLPSGLTAGWNVIYPGGETICSRGDRYMFAVHPGKVNKLVVDFEGGGACWTTASCSVSGALFKERAEDSLKYIQQGYDAGIYDRNNPQNPFKDWYHVFVPYCTGDIHWGDAVKSYGEGDKAFSINHKGAVNVKAVLDWIGKNFGGPDKIFVTGCSAGSYGSLMWANHLIKQYPRAKVYQFGDSGAGVVTASFLADSFANWNALGSAPAWIPALDPAKVDLLSKDVAYLYTEAANYHKGHVFTQFNTLHDKTQVTYFQVMGGGTAAQWSEGMVASIDAVITSAPDFRAYLATGETHCIIPYNEFYSVEVNGTKLVDWVRDLVEDKPVKSERCAACVPAP